MKLRLKGNSIRVRITRRDAEELRARGFCRDTISFAGRQLSYELRIVEDGAIRADFDGSTISVGVPDSTAGRWLASEELGIESVADGLKILIEKDLACSTPRPDEDSSEMFGDTAAGRCL